MATGFRLMTANLLHERCDPDDFARLLTELDPDVVITQELGTGPAEVLANRFPNHRLLPAPDFTGRGIATRLDAQLGDEIPMPGRNGTPAVLNVGGREVRVAGIHLLNPIDFPWWKSVRTRTAQLDGLFSWVEAGTGPVVVAGDCNASPRWPAYKRLASGLTDVVAEWADTGGRRPERTWGWRPGWPRMLRIDHVFGIGIRATNVIVRPVRGSDHHTLTADLVVG